MIRDKIVQDKYCCHLCEMAQRNINQNILTRWNTKPGAFLATINSSRNFLSLVHRRKVAYLSVFYGSDFGEYTRELRQLISPASVNRRTSRLTVGYYPTWSVFFRILNVFCHLLLCREPRNGLPYQQLFEHMCNHSIFKVQMNRHILGELVLSQTLFLLQTGKKI